TKRSAPLLCLVCSAKGTSTRSHELVARRPAAAGARRAGERFGEGETGLRFQIGIPLWFVPRSNTAAAALPRLCLLTPHVRPCRTGRIDADGSIEAGGQNLPGNWVSNAFNLPARLHDAIPEIGESETTIFMHNDAVVQGLSEAPFMHD